MLSTRARRRHERGLERAEEIVDRTAVKAQKSKRSASNIADRKKAWDEVNGSVGKVGSGRNKFAGLADEDDEVESVEEFDAEMEEAAPVASEGAQAAATAVPPPLDDGDEEIL